MPVSSCGCILRCFVNLVACLLRALPTSLFSYLYIIIEIVTARIALRLSLSLSLSLCLSRAPKPSSGSCASRDQQTVVNLMLDAGLKQANADMPLSFSICLSFFSLSSSLHIHIQVYM